MRESEFRERLKDVHLRIQDLIAQIDELRAKTIEGRVAVDNRVLLQQLHPEAAWVRRSRPQTKETLWPTHGQTLRRQLNAAW
jgi:hypothetical protein